MLLSPLHIWILAIIMKKKARFYSLEGISLKKRKQQHATQNEEKMTLMDRLNADLFAQLKEKKKELEAEQQRKKEEEEARKREEQRRREKNKTFEELLNESNLDWRKFKE
jgi:hypothetical protein